MPETSEAPHGVILVNLHAAAGRCSHCSEPANLEVRHSCGAVIDGAVINGHIAHSPTPRQVESVMDRLPIGWRFYGVGIIEKVNGQWRLSMLKTVSELLPHS